MNARKCHNHEVQPSRSTKGRGDEEQVRTSGTFTNINEDTQEMPQARTESSRGIKRRGDEDQIPNGGSDYRLMQ